MLVIIDCDIASTFAKIDRIDLLKRIFSKSDLCITNLVYAELLRARSVGFSFPDLIFSSIRLISIKEEEIQDFKSFIENKKIHTGEAEGLAIAKGRDAVFLTNDSLAVRFCEENGIKVMDLKDILILSAKKRIVDKKEMSNILREIEIKDNTVIKGKEDVLWFFTDGL